MRGMNSWRGDSDSKSLFREERASSVFSFLFWFGLCLAWLNAPTQEACARGRTIQSFGWQERAHINAWRAHRLTLAHVRHMQSSLGLLVLPCIFFSSPFCLGREGGRRDRFPVVKTISQTTPIHREIEKNIE